MRVRLVGLVGFGAFVLVVGNVKPRLLPGTAAGTTEGVLVGLALVAVSLLYAWKAGLRPSDYGLGHWRAAPLSVVLGLAVVVIPLLGSIAVGQLVMFGGTRLAVPDAPRDLALLPWEVVQQRIMGHLLLDTVLPEELVFRGVIWAACWQLLTQQVWGQRRWALPGWLRARAPGEMKGQVWSAAAIGTVIVTALCFVAWHLTIALQESAGDPGAFFSRLAAYGLGGLAFALPLATRNLAGCLVAHWLTNGILMTFAHPAGYGLRSLILGM